MKKILPLLEKYVEWLAVALGAAFFFFMVWTYLISEPVSATYDSQNVTPGNVDDVIANGPIKRLDDSAHGTAIPKLTVPNYPDQLTSSLNLDSLAPQSLANAWDYQPLQLALPGAGNQPQVVAGANAAVDHLPALPAAKPIVVAGGQSTIVDSTNAGARKDVNWATAVFAIPAKSLHDEWKNSFGVKLGDQSSAVFLSATLWRQQKQANGQWGPETEVERPFGSLSGLQFPAAGNKQDEAQYRIDVTAKQGEIVSPKFPELAPAPFGTNIFDPNVYLQNLNAPAPAAPAAAANAQPGGAAAANAGPDISDPTISAIPKALIPTPLPTVRTSVFDPAATDSPDIMLYLYDAAVRPEATYRYRISYQLYNPLFNQPESMASHKEFLDQFSIDGPKSDWSPEFSLPSKTLFFCVPKGTARRANDKSAIFNIYTWANGQWQKETFTVNPGDPIGEVRGSDNVDFSTGYTLVDTRSPESKDKVYYMDDDGLITMKDAEDDQRDEKSKAPKIGAPAAPGAPGAPAADAGNPDATPAPTVAPKPNRPAAADILQRASHGE